MQAKTSEDLVRKKNIYRCPPPPPPPPPLVRKSSALEPMELNGSKGEGLWGNKAKMEWMAALSRNQRQVAWNSEREREREMRKVDLLKPMVRMTIQRVRKMKKLEEAAMKVQAMGEMEDLMLIIRLM
ncbi:hypothetical protein V6N13_142206 [Hibiscus sabdariffa]|uniref:Uncharacterized protein n=1 Tax=Hibiscus sabdariffa TaxID=183260 RepID=A0ABR2FDH8_9ROSI